MEDDVVNFAHPGGVVWRIPSIISMMMAIAFSVHKEDLPKDFLRSTRMLYLVYVLGVVDMCCSMDHGSTVIDQDLHVEHQLHMINRHIEDYPKLLDWVRESIEDWEGGRAMSHHLSLDTIDDGFEAQVWYLTSHDIRCRLHLLKTYRKEGHAAN